MEFYEVLKTRRSIRSYKQDAVSEETLNRILEAARIAPSGSNRQPWRFILIDDEELKSSVAELCGKQMWISEAPIVVVACGINIDYNRGGYMGDMSFMMDVTISFTHLILAARAEGLGTCWIGSFDNDSLKHLLGVPEDVNVVAVTPIGYPKGEGFRKTGKRKNLKEIISENEF